MNLRMFEEFQVGVSTSFFIEDERSIQSLEKQLTMLDASKKRKEFLKACLIHVHVIDCSIFREHVFFMCGRLLLFPLG